MCNSRIVKKEKRVVNSNFLKSVKNTDYKTKEWNLLKRVIFGRDWYTCKKCKSYKRNLQLVHKMFVAGREVWDYDMCNFETFCLDCYNEKKKNGDIAKTVSSKIYYDMIAYQKQGYADLNKELKKLRRGNKKFFNKKTETKRNPFQKMSRHQEEMGKLRDIDIIKSMNPEDVF